MALTFTYTPNISFVFQHAIGIRPAKITGSGRGWYWGKISVKSEAELFGSPCKESDSPRECSVADPALFFSDTV